MRIGIDFDNTIVSYDALFHKVARERAALPGDTPINKVAVREYFRRADQEDLWTELQGIVYGPRMDEASMFEGVLDFFSRANALGRELFVISHRTRYPFRGERHDLHAAARQWIERHLVGNGAALLRREHTFFELTKTDKIARIAECRCDVFIDDLPEILRAPTFPPHTARLLFDPDAHHTSATDLRSFHHWRELSEHLNA